MVCFTHFKSYDRTLEKFEYHAISSTHGTTLHGTKYVIEIKKHYIERLITCLEMAVNKS